MTEGALAMDPALKAAQAMVEQLWQQRQTSGRWSALMFLFDQWRAEDQRAREAAHNRVIRWFKGLGGTSAETDLNVIDITGQLRERRAGKPG